MRSPVADAYVELAGSIIRETAAAYHVDPAAITGPSRRPHLVDARGIVAHRLWTETDLPLMRIGEILGGRDHSTIHHLVRRHELRTSDEDN